MDGSVNHQGSAVLDGSVNKSSGVTEGNVNLLRGLRRDNRQR